MRVSLVLDERRELGSLREHARIRRDETVPGIGVMVKREQQFPNLECRHTRVDPVNGDKRRIGLVVR